MRYRLIMAMAMSLPVNDVPLILLVNLTKL